MKNTKQAKTATKQAGFQALEQAIDTCRKYFSKEAIGDMAPKAQLAIYAMGVEAMPESQRAPMYCLLAAEYARAADEAANNDNRTEAGVYKAIAIHYMQKTGIEVPEQMLAKGTSGNKLGLKDLMREIFYDNEPGKVYSGEQEQKGKTKPYNKKD